MPPRIGFAREMARKCLKKHGVTAPPVPVEEIIRAEGFRLEFVDYPDDTSGESWRKDGVGYMEVNRRHHRNRQRFTMAHELGHLLMCHARHRSEDPSVLERAPRGDQEEGQGETIDFEAKDPVEVEANQFAAELLMPRALFKKDWDTGMEARLLAQRYEVSEEAAWWRIRGFPLR
jgi:Zn-dependent peptidase ImmA (M78 family)